MASTTKQEKLQVVLPGGTTVGEINAWLASLYERGNRPSESLKAPASGKARKVAPRRAPRPIEGQSFAPEPDRRSTRFTKAELERLEGKEFTRNQVRDLMRNPDRVGVCG